MTQTATDGFTMNKGELCLVAGYGQSSWDEYWEGTRLRENLNLGTFTSKQIMPMLGFGVTKKLNLFLSFPYIDNSSSAGTMQGQKGWQDISLDAKYELLEKEKGKHRFNVFATGGISLPAGGYEPDFLPFSIGLGAKTTTLRLIGHWEKKEMMFATVQTGYVMKSNIELDRQSYYTNRQYLSNEMAVPDVWDGSASIGWNNKRFRADFHYNWQLGTSGSDIRMNDVPYPNNKMNAQWLGLRGLLWIPGIKGLALHGGVDKVFQGRNVGKAFHWNTAVQYVFTPFKH
jgi:hypothetical protein